MRVRSRGVSSFLLLHMGPQAWCRAATHFGSDTVSLPTVFMNTRGEAPTQRLHTCIVPHPFRLQFLTGVATTDARRKLVEVGGMKEGAHLELSG